MKPKNSKRIIILSTVIVFLLVCVSFASVWTLANPTMETTHTQIIDDYQCKAVVVSTRYEGKKPKPIGEDPEPEQERSYTKPMYEIEVENVELIVHDSIIEQQTEPAVTDEPTITLKAEPQIEVTTEIKEEVIYFEEPVYMAHEYIDDFKYFSDEEEWTYYPEEEYDNYYTEIEVDYTPIFIEEETEYYEEEIIIEEEPEELDYIDNDLRSNIVAMAQSYVGVTPYVWAGRSLTEGTDCSGFVSLIYGSQGITASPGSNDYQYEYEHIEYEDLQPGDIVVYRDGGHVGIYAGDDTIIHCSNPESGTIESDMWYSEPTAYVNLID